LHYVGPLVDERVRPAVSFPWDKLDGRPLVYGSMGTIQNGSEHIFRAIAEACSTLDCQLVLSLGGSHEPSELGHLAGNPIVVRYAPQLELVKRASAVVTHAGLNTTLESLAEGVPLVAIPQGNDQPGVAARIAHHRAGIVVPLSKLSASRLRRAIDAVLTDGTYRAAASRIQAAIHEIDAVETAANIVENALGLHSTSNQADARSRAPHSNPVLA
ncbi:MAG: MGT family glycosyltransferase, partial [Silvibacterium sp.]|nr:MGT family glycosyltransferase [Silvibacterium sp.]